MSTNSHEDQRQHPFPHCNGHSRTPPAPFIFSSPQLLSPFLLPLQVLHTTSKRVLARKPCKRGKCGSVAREAEIRSKTRPKKKVRKKSLFPAGHNTPLGDETLTHRLCRPENAARIRGKAFVPVFVSLAFVSFSFVLFFFSPHVPLIITPVRRFSCPVLACSSNQRPPISPDLALPHRLLCFSPLHPHDEAHFLLCSCHLLSESHFAIASAGRRRRFLI